MIAPDISLSLAAAALDEVQAAQREVGCLIDEVEGVAGRLRATADIPWSGDAARAWRMRLDATRRDVAGGAAELGELHDLLGALLERLRT